MTIGVVGLAPAAAILAAHGLPSRSVKAEASSKPESDRSARSGRGFSLLLAIAMIDSARRAWGFSLSCRFS